MQHFLKAVSGTARAEIVTPERLEQLHVSTAHRTVTALHVRLAQGTPGGAWTWIQKQRSRSSFLLRAIRASCWSDGANYKPLFSLASDVSGGQE
jgi:hypothetical protein